MTSPINIHSSNAGIELPYGIYIVKVLGGWGVEVGSFSFDLNVGLPFIGHFKIQKIASSCLLIGQLHAKCIKIR